MKTGQRQPWYKNPRVQKYGLYGILAVSLGFNLSMNPEHYNNIARNEKPQVFSTDLASNDSTKYVFTNNGKSYQATVAETKVGEEVITQAVVEELCDCQDKKRQVIGLASNIKNTADWMKELNTKLAVPANPANPGSPAAEVAKPEDKIKDKYEALAKKCDDKSDRSAILNCHAKTIVDFSKELKDSSDSESLVTEYFVSYLQTTLKRGFNGSTFDPMTGEDKSDRLSDANEVAEKLIGGLRGKNGKSVIQALTKMKEASYRAQIVNSENLVRLGKDTNNLFLENLGMQGMNANMLAARFGSDFSSWRSAIDSNRLMSSMDKDDFGNYASQNLGTPVNNLISSLRNYVLRADFKNRNVADVYASFPVDTRGLDNIIVMNPNYPITPGMPNQQNGYPNQQGVMGRMVRGAPSIWDNNQLFGNQQNGNINQQQPPFYQTQQSPGGIQGRVSGRAGATF